ncbi:MAG TPA: helix-turn-helix domain-containing protein [Candidatus Saccharimonadales bacterium]|nr:helix-turn-helix domain-containing protein [Candidatus Saccharimonadales bacterium]
MDKLLTQAGLTPVQASTYLYLLEHGDTAPPVLATKLSLTRTNAYKVLDNLVELGLAFKTEVNKKNVYIAEDPIALSAIVAAERNRVATLEENVRDAMHQLRATYEKSQTDYDVRVMRGNAAVTSLYLRQTKRDQPLWVIEPGVQAPGLHLPRRLPATTATNTQTIKPAPYTEPVEWSVSGDELVIVTFDRKASAVRIKNPAVAQAFRSLWRLLRTHKEA